MKINTRLKKITSGIGFAIVLTAIVAFAGDATRKQSGLPVQIIGNDKQHYVDVKLQGGVRRMQTSATVTVEEIFGEDPQATDFMFFGATLEDADGIGAAGDTVRIEIPAAVSPLNAIYPAVDVTYTIVAGDISDDNPERSVAINTCAALTADANFNTAEWKCIVIKDFAAIHINSKLFNEFGERTSWTITCSGTTTCGQGFSDLSIRGKPTELSRSPNDPRKGILAISGSVVQTPGGASDIQLIFFENVGSPDMRVDGSSTPVEFEVGCDATNERLINEIRVFGGCNGLKFGQFMCKNTTLTNGILVEIRSNGQLLTLPDLMNTEDFKNKFAFGPAGPGGNFRLDIQAGGDQMVASFVFAQPAILEPCGTVVGGDDFVRITIRDNLTGSIGGNLSEFSGMVQGFEREP